MSKTKPVNPANLHEAHDLLAGDATHEALAWALAATTQAELIADLKEARSRALGLAAALADVISRASEEG